MKIKRPEKQKEYKWVAAGITEKYNKYYWDGRDFYENNPDKAYIFSTAHEAMEVIGKHLGDSHAYTEERRDAEKDIQIKEKIKGVVESEMITGGVIFIPVDIDE